MKILRKKFGQKIEKKTKKNRGTLCFLKKKEIFFVEFLTFDGWNSLRGTNNCIQHRLLPF